MEPTRQVLIQVVEGAGLFLAFLTIAIVVNKGRREVREALDRRGRAVLEPRVLEYMRSTTTRPLGDVLPRSPSRRERRLVEGILLESARLANGGSRDRLTAAFDSLGAVRGTIRALQSPRWWRRADAAERLGLMRSEAAIEPLVRLMNDPVPEVRLRAAQALGLIRGRTSIRPLVGALADPSRWSAIRVAEILIRVGSEAVDELLAAFDTLPLSGRVSALDVLGRIRSPRAISLMRRCLEDPHPDIRARSAHGLGLVGDPATAADLVAALQDAEWPVRAMAAKSLGRLGAASAIPRLRNTLRDRQWWVRHNSGEALRQMGTAGLDALTDALVSDDPYARHMAVAQLEEGRVIDRFVSELTSADTEKRAAAIRFVDKVTAAARVDDRTRQAAASAQESLRRALSRILEAPEPRPPAGGGAP